MRLELWRRRARRNDGDVECDIDGFALDDIL
jgi:hypothetical protein